MVRSLVDVSVRKSIIRGAYLGYVYLGVVVIVGFILTPVMLRYLGQAGYGLWAAFGAITGYLMLFNFGMSVAATKYTAEYRAIGDQENLNKILSSLFVGFLIVGTLVVLGSVGLSPFLPRFFAVPEDLVTVGSIAFIITGSTVALRLVAGLFGNIIYGFQRVDVLKGISIIQVGASALLTIAFLRLDFGLIGVALAAFLSSLMLMVLYLLFIRRSTPEIKIHLRLANVGVFKQIGPYSIRSFSLGLSSQIIYQADSIIIGGSLGAGPLAPYAVAKGLLAGVQALFTLIPATVFPRFSHLYAQGNLDEVRRLFVIATKMSTAAMVPLALSLGFWGQEFIDLWVGHENFVGTNIFIVLLAMLFLHSSAADVVLQGTGNNKGLTYSALVHAGLALLLSIVLVRTLGILGVALGNMVAHLLTSTWVEPLLACKCTKLPVLRYITSAIMPPILAGIPAGGISWVVAREIAVGNSFVDLGLKALLVVTTYSVIYLTFAATRQERRMYIGLLRGMARA